MAGRKRRGIEAGWVEVLVAGRDRVPLAGRVGLRFFSQGGAR